MRHSIFALALAVSACAAAPGPQAAPEPTGPAPSALEAEAAARGEAIATRVCAACHALQAGQASPRPPAPPFPTLAGRFTELTLHRRLTEISELGHSEMPPLAVHTNEVDDLVAYLNRQPAP